jgi:hypothetical protein
MHESYIGLHPLICAINIIIRVYVNRLSEKGTLTRLWVLSETEGFICTECSELMLIGP